MEARRLLAGDTNIGAVRPDGGILLQQLLDTQALTGRIAGDENPEISFDYGFNSTAPAAGTTGNDIALAGDLSGVGFDQVVVARGLPGGALQWLGDTDRDETQEYQFRFGNNDWIPLIADMNGDGVDDVIAVDTTTNSDLLEWHVHYGVPGANPFPTDDSPLSTDATFSFGVDADHPSAGNGLADIPRVGDIDNDGSADVLVYRINASSYDVYVDNYIGALPTNVGTVLGNDPVIATAFIAGDIPIVGNWDNIGGDNLGAINTVTPLSTWQFDTSGDGIEEFSLEYGLPGDQYIVGSWPDVVWDGEIDSNWSTAANWSGGVLPAIGDVVVIDQPSAASTIVSTGTATIGILQSTEALSITSGTLTATQASRVDGGVAVTSTGQLIVQAPFAADVAVDGSSARLRVASDNRIEGSITLTNAAEIDTAGNRSMDAAVSLGSGFEYVTADRTLTLTGTITVTSNNPTLRVQSSSSSVIVDGVIDDGTSTYAINKTGAGTLILNGINTSGGNITGMGNSGIIVQDSAQIVSSGSGPTAASISLDGDGTASIGVRLANTGVRLQSNSGAINIDGQATNAVGFQMDNAVQMVTSSGQIAVLGGGPSQGMNVTSGSTINHGSGSTSFSIFSFGEWTGSSQRIKIASRTASGLSVSLNLISGGTTNQQNFSLVGNCK